MQQTLYYNGNIITMAGDRTCEAILVENGVITALGSNEEMLSIKEPDAEMVNLNYRTMLPAFIDPHSHFSSVASSMDKVPLSDCNSMEEIVEKLRAFKTKHGLDDQAFLVGFGYDHNNLPNLEHPTADILDRASETNPILIAHASGHMGVANHAMLKKIGLDDNSPDPQGGLLGRNADGKLNGYLEENAFITVATNMPAPSAETMAHQFQLAQEYYASYGIATVQDGMVNPQLEQSLKALGKSGTCALDIIGYMNVATGLDCLPEHPKEYEGRYRAGGMKMFLDGSPQGRTAWMSEPYLGEDPDYCGYPIFTDEQVEGFIRIAISHNLQLLTHCNGDAAAEQLIRCYGKVKAELGSTADLRPVMIHAQTVRKDQLDRMADLGMMPSFFVVHTYYWGDVHMRNFGPKRAKAISPARWAIEDGLKYTFHQDSPVVPPDMLLTLWAAVNRQSKGGNDIGREEQGVSVMDALRGITINAAYQYFEEDRKGSLEVGKLADLVILDKDPRAVEPMELRDLVVLETIKEGRTIYKHD